MFIFFNTKKTFFYFCRYLSNKIVFDQNHEIICDDNFSIHIGVFSKRRNKPYCKRSNGDDKRDFKPSK